MGASVLLVEDEDAVALTLQQVLTSIGYRVETASTTSEALQKLKGAALRRGAGGPAVGGR